jgi:UDP-N-acetylglucosamine--N-acetylmuramyl-(pentapeptide) pyrophosphoryl-undecaprenol N-acetylglucosamine transferase
LVMGGSQGSKELNEQLPGRLEALLASGEWQVLHQCGTKWAETFKPSLKKYYPVGYVDAVAAWSAADFAICRSGAGTLADAAYHGVPLLLVPLPANIDSGAQWANARFAQSKNAALTLPDWDSFDKTLAQMLDAKARLVMAENMHAMSPEGAAERVCAMVEK